MAKIRPIVDYDVCSCCGACAAKCPVSVIEMDVKKQRRMCLCIYPRLADDVNCLGCGVCADACPVEAITMYEYDDNGMAKIAQMKDEPYKILEDKCKGCTMCARVCPVGAIEGKLKEVHKIDPDICVQCGKCMEKCKLGAIVRG